MNKKIKKYSLYFWIPLAMAVIMLIGFLIGVTVANNAKQGSFITELRISSNEPEWR